MCNNATNSKNHCAFQRKQTRGDGPFTKANLKAAVSVLFLKISWGFNFIYLDKSWTVLAIFMLLFLLGIQSGTLTNLSLPKTQVTYHLTI